MPEPTLQDLIAEARHIWIRFWPEHGNAEPACVTVTACGRDGQLWTERVIPVETTFDRERRNAIGALGCIVEYVRVTDVDEAVAAIRARVGRDLPALCTMKPIHLDSRVIPAHWVTSLPEEIELQRRREAAAALGRSRSPAKQAAARANGKKGGRPRKTDEPQD